MRSSGGQDTVMAALFEHLQLLSGSPKETIERLVCTQKLRGAPRDWVDSRVHGKESLQLHLVPVWLRVCMSGWLELASHGLGCGSLRATGRKDIERLCFSQLVDLRVNLR